MEEFIKLFNKCRKSGNLEFKRGRKSYFKSPLLFFNPLRTITPLKKKKKKKRNYTINLSRSLPSSRGSSTLDLGTGREILEKQLACSPDKAGSLSRTKSCSNLIGQFIFPPAIENRASLWHEPELFSNLHLRIISRKRFTNYREKGERWNVGGNKIMARLKFNKNRMKSSILFSTLSSRFTSQIKKKKKSEYKREELKVSQRLG